MITCENSSGRLKEAIKVKTEPSEWPSPITFRPFA